MADTKEKNYAQNWAYGFYPETPSDYLKGDDKKEAMEVAAKGLNAQNPDSWFFGPKSNPNIRRYAEPFLDLLQKNLTELKDWFFKETPLGRALSAAFETNSGEHLASIWDDNLFYVTHDVLKQRFDNPDKFIEQDTKLKLSHSFEIENNRLKVLNTLLEKDPNNITLLKEITQIQSEHWQLLNTLKEGLKKDNRVDYDLQEKINKLEKDYEKNKSIIRASNTAENNYFVKQLEDSDKNGKSKYANHRNHKHIDYTDFVIPLAKDNISSEAKNLLLRLDEGRLKTLASSINIDLIKDESLKNAVQAFKTYGSGFIKTLSAEQSALLLGLCDSKEYEKVTLDAFKSELHNLTMEEKKRIVSNNKLQKIEVGGIMGRDMAAIGRYCGNQPTIEKVKQGLQNPQFIKELEVLAGSYEHKNVPIMNLYGFPRDAASTASHEATHSNLAASGVDIPKNAIFAIKEACENKIGSKIKEIFPDFNKKQFTAEERKAVIDAGFSNSGNIIMESHNKIKIALNDPDVKPDKELVQWFANVMQGKNVISDSNGKPVQNNLLSIKDENTRAYLALKYFQPTKPIGEEGEKQLSKIRKGIEEFEKDNPELCQFYNRVFAQVDTSSAYNKNSSTEEYFVRIMEHKTACQEVITKNFSKSENAKEKDAVIRNNYNNIQGNFQKIQSVSNEADKEAKENAMTFSLLRKAYHEWRLSRQNPHSHSDHPIDPANLKPVPNPERANLNNLPSFPPQPSQLQFTKEQEEELKRLQDERRSNVVPHATHNNDQLEQVPVR